MRLRVEYRWKSSVYYLFYRTQGLDNVFGVEDIRVRSRLKLLVSSLAKGASFFQSFFSLGKSKKSLSLVVFWNRFGTWKWHNTSTPPVLHLSYLSSLEPHPDALK